MAWLGTLVFTVMMGIFAFVTNYTWRSTVFKTQTVNENCSVFKYCWYDGRYLCQQMASPVKREWTAFDSYEMRSITIHVPIECVRGWSRNNTCSVLIPTVPVGRLETVRCPVGGSLYPCIWLSEVDPAGIFCFLFGVDYEIPFNSTSWQAPNNILEWLSLLILSRTC